MTSEEKLQVMVFKAELFATEAHKGQFRKGGKGIEYITHPLKVKSILEAVGVDDPITIAAALLHDTIEDCGVLEFELAAEFGLDVASVVLELSDSPGLTRKQAKAAQEKRAPTMSGRAKMVKVADKTANLIDMIENPPGWSREAAREYVESAVRIVKAMGPVNDRLNIRFNEAAEIAMRSTD